MNLMRFTYPLAPFCLGIFLPGLIIVAQALPAYSQEPDSPNVKQVLGRSASLTAKADTTRSADLNQEGVSLLFEGKQKAGFTKIKEALSLDPNNATALYNIAGLYLSKGVPAQAVKTMEHALTIEPEDTAFLNRLGEAHMANRNAAASIRAFERLLKLNPSYEQAHLRLGTLYGIRQQWEKAESVLQIAYKLNSHDIRVITNLGSVLIVRGKPEEALVILDKVKLTDLDLEITRALAHQELSQPKDALRHLRNAQKLGAKMPDLEKRIKKLESQIN